MESFTQWLDQISNMVWGPPLLVLLVGTGIYLSIRLSFFAIFPTSLRFENRLFLEAGS